MQYENIFRWLFALVFLLNLSISGYFRHKARAAGETIKRSQESLSMVLMRVIFTLPLLLSIIAYLLDPQWMAWSSLGLPLWARVIGVGIGLSAAALLFWVMRSIGSNISETVLTKNEHTLVTHGPYRWVRHPLYSTGALNLIALSLIAANWFMALLALTGIFMIVFVVIPKEETALIEKFGDDYVQYRKRTGKIAPRLKPVRQSES